MATTNNLINAPTPFSATNGGTGVSAPTAHGILVAEGASPVNPIVLTAGQVLIGTTAADPVGATITGSNGVTVSAISGAISITGSGQGFAWNNVSGTSQAALVNNGYITSNAAQTTVTLPATAALGSVVEIKGLGAGGWILAANTGQTIIFGTATTASGGNLTSGNANDGIKVICVVANTTWSVNPVTTNITVN